jgi:hypothetical protein
MAKAEMYQHREVGIFLRNGALAATRHEAAPVAPPRQAQLRAYAMGLIEALAQDVEEGYLSWIELVVALAAAAHVLHQTRVPRQVER